jgi:hypothetical protein
MKRDNHGKPCPACKRAETRSEIAIAYVRDYFRDHPLKR